MVERLNRVKLEEMQRVRLFCKQCETVTEIPTPELAKYDVVQKCPRCKSTFFPGANPKEDNPLLVLEKAIALFKNADSKVSIEFEWAEK